MQGRKESKKRRARVSEKSLHPLKDKLRCCLNHSFNHWPCSAPKDANKNNDISQNIEAPAANTTETILRDLKDRRSKYKVGLKTHIEEQDDIYNKDAEWQMWEEIIDEITGKPYYHNVATGKTQWNMPQGLALAYEGQEQELLKDFTKKITLKNRC